MIRSTSIPPVLNPYSPNPLVRYFTAPVDGVTAGGDPGDQGQPPAPAAPADPPAPADPGTDDEKLGEGGVKALQAEREARRQAEAAAAELKAKVQEFEDKSKSEEEKAAERLAELEKSSTTNAIRVLQYEVAAAKGLDLAAATRLRGSTKEELEADADELKTLLGSATPVPPKPDPSQGAGTNKSKPASLSDAVNQHYA